MCIGISSSVNFLLGKFRVTVESVVVPVSFSLNAILVQEDSASLAYSLEIKAFEEGAVWLQSPAVPGAVAILEDTLVHPVVWEDHAAKSLGLVELVQQTGINEILSFNCLDLNIFCEEKFNQFVLDCVQVALFTVVWRELPVQ